MIRSSDSKEPASGCKRVRLPAQLTALWVPVTYDGDPMGMDQIKGAVRQDFIQTAEVLDQYNNGYIGLGHCSE